MLLGYALRLAEAYILVRRSKRGLSMDQLVMSAKLTVLELVLYCCEAWLLKTRPAPHHNFVVVVIESAM